MPSRLECFREMSPTKVSRQVNQEVVQMDSTVEARREMNTNCGFQMKREIKEADNMEVKNEKHQEKEEEEQAQNHEEEEEEIEDQEEEEMEEEEEEEEEEDQVEGSDDDLEQNSEDTEEEEDQFDQESEPSESITEEQVIPPFWFAHEDDDHIKAIFNLYSKHIKIEEIPVESNNGRSPQLFVGSVKRTALRNCGDFMTLDEVRVYKKLAIPPGVPLPIEQKILLLTSWNEEGLPWQISSATLSMKTFWSQRAVEVSYLIRFPSRSQRDEDDFVVAQADLEVTYSQNCGTKLCYEPYLTDFKNDSYFLENLPYQLENLQLELCPY